MRKIWLLVVVVMSLLLPSAASAKDELEPFFEPWGMTACGVSDAQVVSISPIEQICVKSWPLKSTTGFTREFDQRCQDAKQILPDGALTVIDDQQLDAVGQWQLVTRTFVGYNIPALDEDGNQYTINLQGVVSRGPMDGLYYANASLAIEGNGKLYMQGSGWVSPLDVLDWTQRQPDNGYDFGHDCFDMPASVG